MAIYPIGVAGGTDMASAGGGRRKGIELHEGMRGIDRTRHTTRALPEEICSVSINLSLGLDRTLPTMGKGFSVLCVKSILLFSISPCSREVQCC